MVADGVRYLVFDYVRAHAASLSVVRTFVRFGLGVCVWLELKAIFPLQSDKFTE